MTIRKSPRAVKINLKEKLKSERELPRKIFHLAGLLLLFIPYFFPKEAGKIFLGLAILESTLEIFRLSFPELSQHLEPLWKPLLRHTEKTRPSGSFYYLWGVALSFLLFGGQCGTSGLLVLALGDPIAGIFHARSKKKFLKKSLLGSLSLALISFVVLDFLWPWPVSLVTAFAASLVENLCPGNDNFVLPLFVSGLLFVLTAFDFSYPFL